MLSLLAIDEISERGDYTLLVRQLFNSGDDYHFKIIVQTTNSLLNNKILLCFVKTMPGDYPALTISFISQLLRNDEIILKYFTRSYAMKRLIDIA